MIAMLYGSKKRLNQLQKEQHWPYKITWQRKLINCVIKTACASHFPCEDTDYRQVKAYYNQINANWIFFFHSISEETNGTFGYMKSRPFAYLVVAKSKWVSFCPNVMIANVYNLSNLIDIVRSMSASIFV